MKIKIGFYRDVFGDTELIFAIRGRTIDILVPNGYFTEGSYINTGDYSSTFEERLNLSTRDKVIFMCHLSSYEHIGIVLETLGPKLVDE